MQQKSHIEFGGNEPTRNQSERQGRDGWIGAVLRDVRYALRGFRRNPIFAISVLVTLSLGIGATTAVFSVVNRILFLPLPYADPGRIVSLGFVNSLLRQEFVTGRFYREWQIYQTPFSALTAQSLKVNSCDLVEDNPAELGCVAFQSSFLPLFGISPVLGRNFLPEEDQTNGPSVVIISYGLWNGHYSRDPHILDRTINVDGSPSRVVGVLPKDFQFPTLESADIVLPLAFNPANQQMVNGGFGYPMRLFARLKPGVSMERAYAQMQPLFEDDLRVLPAPVKRGIQLSVRSLRDRETHDLRPTAWILLAFVLAFLLIACANVAGLMVARGAGRRRELAVRLAMGASRGRLIRQSLTEALLLSFIGTLAGLSIAQALVKVFVRIAPTGIPFISNVHLDLRIALFAALLSCLCGMAFGLAAALEKPALSALNAKASVSRNSAFLRQSLVTAQIAVSIILLSGAFLLLRSFAKIEEQDLKMKSGGVLTMKVALPWGRYNTNQKVMNFYLRLESSLRLPGISAVGISDSVPPGGWQSAFIFSGLHVEGRPPIPAGTGGNFVGRSVTPDYFRALGIPIVRGRNFAEADRAGHESEAILSRLLAARLFPNEDPIGKSFQLDGASGGAATVIGVADNVKNNGLTEQTDPEMYTLRRNTPDHWGSNKVVVIIHSSMPASAVEQWARSAVASIDRTAPIVLESLDSSISRLEDRQRFETTLLGFFALTGLVMALIGLYGLIAFLTIQRTQEIGVRMALGATHANILFLIAKDGLRMVLIGMTIGLGTALTFSRVFKTLLFQVSAYDPMTYLAVPLLISTVALVAILVPARAGIHVEPAVTLKAE